METCENCKMNRLCKELDALGYTRGCNTLHPIRKTNADKIRQMTDDELAQHLFDVANYACPPGKEFTTVVCGKYPDCKKCWLDWLKQEVDGDRKPFR